MATNNFVYCSDGLGGRAFDHHSRNEGAGHFPTKTARRARHFNNFFKCLGVYRGGDACGWN